MITNNKPPFDPLKKSLEALHNKSESVHIKSLRFPNYRNLELGSVLQFKYPITVLLGRNGTNKSSILHALYGSVMRNTIADFWFETEIDAIPETINKMKQSVVHSYLNEQGKIVESIKARAPRHEADPDYWETIKPTTVYGFPPGAKRISPIQLKVYHLDFRGELPAFDKYFYFPDQKHLSQRARQAKSAQVLRRGYRKQDYLRRRSGILKNHMESLGSELKEEELEILRYILEQPYTSGRVLKHSLFHGHEGWTIIFKTKHIQRYSEAFAGSGESAIAMIVHKVLNAEKNSLILLDEPETSLHPRAQQRLLEFLAHQSFRKNLQVVLATHSIYLAKELPQSAIRVLEMGPNGRINISTDYSATEALHEIGTFPYGKTIIVEDERAKKIVVESLKQASLQAAQEFRVQVRAGGTSRIFDDIRAFVNLKRNDVFVILDGDHRPNFTIPIRDNLPQGKTQLNSLIRRITRGPNKKGPKLDFVDKVEMTEYIEFLRKNVDYLPKKTPEELVWSENEAVKLVNCNLPNYISTESNDKKRLELLSNLVPGLDSETVFTLLLSRFLESSSEDLNQLSQIIKKIRSIQ